jgi:hypothetical protein
MTSATDFTAATRNAKDLFTSTLDSWKDGLNSVSDQFRTLPTVGSFPQLDVTGAVERQYAFIQQIVDLNHQYARQLAEVATALSDVTRQQIESVSGVVRDQLQSVSDVARNGVDTVEKAAREQAEQAERQQVEAEQAERQRAREAAKAERQERKEAQDKAREKYQGLSKAELAEQAASRDLPKTGTVDELVERLVDADTK